MTKYKCGHETNETIILDDNLLSMSAYIQWAEEENNLETKEQCWECYCKNPIYKQRFVEDDLTAQEDLKKIKREKRFDFAIMRFKEFSLCIKEQNLGCSIDDWNMILGIVYREVRDEK